MQQLPQNVLKFSRQRPCGTCGEPSSACSLKSSLALATTSVEMRRNLGDKLQELATVNPFALSVIETMADQMLHAAQR